MKSNNKHPFLALRRNPNEMKIDSSGYWSYPAMVVKDNALHWVCLILPTVAMREKKRTALFRPKSKVVLKANSPVLISFQNLRFGGDLFPEVGWEEPIGMFPHKDLWGMTYKQLEEAENQLLCSYDEAGNSFLAGNSLPDTFIENYLRLLHPALLPFLKVVAPSFVSALTPKITEAVSSIKRHKG